MTQLGYLAQDCQPGRCLACDDPLPPRERRPGPDRKLCGSRDCLRLYQMLWKRDSRAKARGYTAQGEA